MSEKRWSQKESPEVFQTSSLRSEESDAQLGFQFEWIQWSKDHNPDSTYPSHFSPMKSKPVLKEIQAISFDLDDTLWHTAPVIKKAQTKIKQHILEEFQQFNPETLDEEFMESLVLVREENPEINHNLTELRRLSFVKMLDKYVAYHGINVEDEKFTDKLCQWAEVTRKSYQDDAIDEMITTRRLFHILEIYSIVQDKERAIHYAIARFDEEVRDSFVSLYKKIDDTIFDENHQPVNKEDMVMLTVLVNETFHKNFPNEPNGTLSDEQVHEFIKFCNDAPEVSQLPQSFDRKNEAEEIKNTELKND